MTFKFVIGTLLVSLLAGCSASVAPSLPPTSPTAAPTETSATPMASHPGPGSSEQVPTPDVTATLGPDAVAEVVTSDLVVRSAPGVSAESEIYPELLNEPTLLFVVDGPVAADGFDWYLVEPFSRNACVDLCPARPPFGWVAQAGTDGEPWIAPAALDCPSPEVGDIGSLSPTARLACYSDDTLVLEGTLGSCYAAEVPIALLQTGCDIRLVEGEEPGTLTWTLIVRPGNGVDMPMEQPGVRMTVTGHFDDASAPSCQWPEGFNDAVGNPGVEPPSPQAVILLCRQQFVVTDIALAEQ